MVPIRYCLRNERKLSSFSMNIVTNISFICDIWLCFANSENNVSNCVMIAILSASLMNCKLKERPDMQVVNSSIYHCVIIHFTCNRVPRATSTICVDVILLGQCFKYSANILSKTAISSKCSEGESCNAKWSLWCTLCVIICSG